MRKGEESEGDPEVEEEMVVERGAVRAGVRGKEPWGEQERGAGGARDAGERHVFRIARSVWRLHAGRSRCDVEAIGFDSRYLLRWTMA